MKKNGFIQHQTGAGFTLIEILLYTSLAGAILLSVSIFWTLLLQVRIKNQTMGEVEEQGAFVSDLVTQTIQNSEAINSPTTGVTSSSLSLMVPAPKNPTIFDLSGGVIRITEGAGSAVPLTNSRVIASELSFQNLSSAATPGTAKVSFTLTHINPGSKNEYEYAKTFYSNASLRPP